MSALSARRKSRLLAAVIVTLLAVGLLWGIASAMASSESPAADGGKITCVWGGPVIATTSTRSSATSRPATRCGHSTTSCWSASAPATYANVPGVGLATAWETSDDGKVWTFTITDQSMWQDGKPLTAADVAFTFNYIINNELGMFTDYINFIDKVEATDATHVVFTCSKAKANMLGLWIPILPEHIWSKVKPSEVENKFKNPPPIIGSGPFQTVEWKKGEFLRMEANKSYWRGAPKVDEVIFQMYQNQDTMAQDLKTGAIQSAWNIPGAQFDALEQRADLDVDSWRHHRLSTSSASTAPTRRSTRSRPGTRSCRTRPSAAPCSGQSTRRRSSRSATTATPPPPTPSHRDYLPGRGRLPPDATERPAYTFDLDKARQALDEAGYPDATATASVSTTASRSSCASTRAPSRPRARTAAS